MSAFPTGSVVAVACAINYSGDVNGAGTTGRVLYNGSAIWTSYMVTTWARSNVVIGTFTKAAGVDSCILQALKDNASATNYCNGASFVAWRIG